MDSSICKNLEYSSINGATVTIKSNYRWENGDMKQFHLCTVTIHPQSNSQETFRLSKSNGQRWTGTSF